MEEIKRPRGRPKLSEEEKAKRKAERAQKKLQERMPEQKQKVVNRLPPEELKEIERVQAIMAKADEAKRAQFVMPQVKEEVEGNRNIITIAPAKEFTIDDEYVRGNDKPAFVQKDDEGWVDPERA